MKKQYTIFFGLLIVCSLLFVGCDQLSGKKKVRWFVGLGAGTNEATLEPQKKVVADFNAQSKTTEIELEIVVNNQAYDTLATEMAAGNAPDIVGPVGIRGRDSFKGSWLDLQPLVDKTKYDMSDFDQAFVKFYNVEGEGMLGLPFAVYPSYLFVNKDLFDQAKLKYPPQKFGEKYVLDGKEVEWNFDTLKEIGMRLTIDKNGKNAKDKAFDKENVVQFGYYDQWTDARGVGTMFGASNFVAADGKTAQVSPDWIASWKWFQDGMWKNKFIPNGPQVNSDILAKGNTFDSGNIALVHCHVWYAGCCVGTVTSKAQWDMAVVPAYNGKYTAKMHADTFEIMKASKNPDAAFEVMAYLIGPAANELCKIYGAMPARKSLQGSYFEAFTKEKFPTQKLNWQVALDSIQYNDNPNHEAWMPSFQESSARYSEFWTRVTDKPETDIDAEVVTLKADLQKIFDAANAKAASK